MIVLLRCFKSFGLKKSTKYNTTTLHAILFLQRRRFVKCQRTTIHTNPCNPYIRRPLPGMPHKGIASWLGQGNGGAVIAAYSLSSSIETLERIITLSRQKCKNFWTRTSTLSSADVYTYQRSSADVLGKVRRGMIEARVGSFEFWTHRPRRVK